MYCWKLLHSVRNKTKENQEKGGILNFFVEKDLTVLRVSQ